MKKVKREKRMRGKTAYEANNSKIIMKLEAERGKKTSLINTHQPVPCGKHVLELRRKGYFISGSSSALARERSHSRLMGHHRNPKSNILKAR